MHVSRCYIDIRCTFVDTLKYENYISELIQFQYSPKSSLLALNDSAVEICLFCLLFNWIICTFNGDQLGSHKRYLTLKYHILRGKKQYLVVPYESNNLLLFIF